MKPGDKFAKVFERIDSERTGAIFLTDLLKYFQTKKIDIQHIPRKDLSNAFSKMEPDKSKGVSKEKFINYCSGNCTRPFYELVNKVAELEGMNRTDFGQPSPRGSESRKSLKFDLFSDREDFYSAERIKEIEAMLIALRNQLEQKMRELQFLIDAVKGLDLHRSQSLNNLDASARKSLDPHIRQNIENQENLKQEISDIQARINQLMSEANELKLLNQNFSFSMNDYMLDRDKDKGLDDIKNEYEQKKLEIEKLIQENEKLNFNLEEKDYLLQKKDEELSNKDSELQSIRDRLAYLEAQLNREKGDASTKYQDLQKSIETNRTLEITNYEIKVNLQKAENERKQLENDIKEMKNTFHKENEKLKNENFELQRILNQSTSKADDLSRDKLEAVIKQQELQKTTESLNQAVQGLQTSNQELKSLLMRYENEKKNLENEIKELKSNYHKDQEKLQAENLELQRALNQTNSKSEDLNMQIQTVQKLKEDNDNFLRAALQEKEKLVITLRNEIQQKGIESKRATEEKSDLQTTLKLIQIELETKENHIASLEKEKANLRNKVAEIQADTTKQHEAEKQKNDRLQDDLQTSQTTIENLLKESLALKNKLDFQVQKTQELEVQLSVKAKSLDENVKEASNFVRQVEMEKKIVDQEIANLKKEYQLDKQKLQTENSELQQTINKLESAMNDLNIKNQTLGLLKDEADKVLKKSLEEKELQLLDVKNELEKKSSENKIKMDEIEALKASIRSKQAEIESREESISVIQREKITLVNKIENLETVNIQQKTHDNKKLEKLQGNLLTVQHANEKLQKDLANSHTLIEKKQLVIEELENKYLIQKKYYDDMIKDLMLKIEGLEKEKKMMEDGFADYKKVIKEELGKLETENSELHIQINQLKSRVEEQNLTIQTITKSSEESELILKASLEEKEKLLLELKNKVQAKNAAIRRANADSNEAQIIITAREQDIKYRDQVIATLDSEKNKLNILIRDLEKQLGYFKNQESEKVEKLQNSLQSSQATISNLQKEIIMLRTNFEISIKRSGSDSKDDMEDKTQEMNQIMQESMQKFSEYKEKKEREIHRLKLSYEERIKELELSLKAFTNESDESMNSQNVLFSLKKSNELLKIQLEESQKLLGQLRNYSKQNEEVISGLRKEIAVKLEIIARLEKEISGGTKTKFKLIEGSSYKYESELIFVKASLEQKEEELAKVKAENLRLIGILKNQPNTQEFQIVEPMISPRTNKLRWPGLKPDQK